MTEALCLTMSNGRSDGVSESRWPVLVAMLGVIGVYTALPDSLVVGPRWLHPALLVAMIIATLITHRRGDQRLNQVLGHILAALITFFMIVSLTLLVMAVPTNKEAPLVMVRSAAALWITNVLVFAYWYWRLDRGGPFQRRMGEDSRSPAFLFPQMMLPAADGDARWSPMFIDYLFLAFNTSTAFSPTDTAVLSRWAKVLTMIQAAISLTVVVVLAARAINIV
jgi:hypothetical protein